MPAYETLKYQLARISDETSSLLDDAEKVIEPTDEGAFPVENHLPDHI